MSISKTRKQRRSYMFEHQGFHLAEGKFSVSSNASFQRKAKIPFIPKLIADVPLKKHMECKYTNYLWSNHANSLEMQMRKIYNVFKFSLKNKEDHVKHRSKSKPNWRWQPDILITTSDSDSRKKGAHGQVYQGLRNG